MYGTRLRPCFSPIRDFVSLCIQSIRRIRESSPPYGGLVKVDFGQIRSTLKGCISELRRSYKKVSPEMNDSERALSNAHLNIPNGCLRKKLQPFKDNNKIEKSCLRVYLWTLKGTERLHFCQNREKNCSNYVEKSRRS